MKKYKNINQYIRSFPPSTRKALKQMRATIKKAAPKSTEGIKYGIPTFIFHGNLVHFGGYKKFVSFYPTSSGTENFKNKLRGYKKSRGTIQFPLDEKLPLALITKITKFRVKEALAKAKAKAKKKVRK